MPSWSIPKGPTLDNTIKRLAMPTEDHEMEYRHFEGVIPAKNYGAGPVMIWDEGIYHAEVEISKGLRSEISDPKKGDEAMKKGLKDGNLKFRLFGKKLQGSFALVRTKGMSGGSKGKDSWLLLKHKDQYCVAGYDANNFDVSATTGRSMDEIAREAKTP
jgi:bifunctional non-homologous end joining protein LigD